jgi:hypothetical protein
VEGDILIAPITGRALYEPGSVSAVMDTRSRRLLNTSHAPYTLDSLGQALRQGVHVSGRSLHPLMPRYQLSDEDIQNLDAYLKTLSPRWSPGVTAQQIRIASVITPDVDEKRRTIAVDTIRALVNRKNLATRPGRRHMVGALEFVMRTERRWEHELWELSGPKETWLAQLQERQAKNPVFAIASGVSGDGTALHTFCESQAVPCWFPVIETLPAIADQSYYGLYFSSGVRLEARGIAQQIAASAGRVLQVISNDASAQSAAAQVESSLTRSTASERLVVGQATPGQLAQAMESLTPNDVVVLWLRATDLEQLQALPVPIAAVWMGGGLAGGEHATLPDAWKRKISVEQQTAAGRSFAIPAVFRAELFGRDAERYVEQSAPRLFARTRRHDDWTPRDGTGQCAIDCATQPAPDGTGPATHRGVFCVTGQWRAPGQSCRFDCAKGGQYGVSPVVAGTGSTFCFQRGLACAFCTSWFRTGI